jgi:hypothetical protein
LVFITWLSTNFFCGSHLTKKKMVYLLTEIEIW